MSALDKAAKAAADSRAASGQTEADSAATTAAAISVTALAKSNSFDTEVGKLVNAVGQVGVAGLQIDNVEFLNIHSKSGDKVDGLIPPNKLTLNTKTVEKIVIDGDEALSLTTGAHTVKLEIDAKGLKLAKGDKLTLDAKLATNAVKITGGESESIVTIGSAGGEVALGTGGIA